MSSPIGSNSRSRKAISFTSRLAAGWFWRRGAAALALATGLLAVGGCASTTSDMPWNTPQSWEGSPTIPGFSGR